MFFIEWRFLGIIATALLVIAGAVFAFVSVRHKRRLARWMVRIASVLVGTVALLLLLLLEVASSLESNSKLVYSPTGRVAARVTTNDEGALGGSTFVQVFSTHGFHQDSVYLGDWGSVGAGDLHWKDDSHLEVHHESASMYWCKSTRTVVVECRPRPIQVQ
jgi:hypothetical protein